VAGYVDMHSHVVFGVDDGAESLAHAVELVTAARDAGTRLLVATPHVVPPYLDWNASAQRLDRIRRRFALLRDAAPAGIELRLGYEVTARPARLRADDDPARFRIEGTELVLMDGPQAVPWHGDATMERLIRRIRAEGLTPILAHPERRACWRGVPKVAWPCWKPSTWVGPSRRTSTPTRCARCVRRACRDMRRTCVVGWGRPRRTARRWWIVTWGRCP